MSELANEKVTGMNKPIWKTKSFWIISVILFLILAYNLGSANNVPEGIEEDYYENALTALHELNSNFEDGEYANEKVTNWVSNHARSIEAYPSDYTMKEIYLNEQFIKMVLGVSNIKDFGEGQGFEEEVYVARANIAEVLEVDEDY